MARRKEPREIGEDTGLGIDIDGDGKSDFSISLKTIGMVLVGIATLIGCLLYTSPSPRDS